MTLPFPDKIALKLVSFIPGRDQFRRNLRRTVMRYVNLSIILVFRLVSLKVHQRLPTMQSLIDAKLLLKHEAERLKKVRKERIRCFFVAFAEKVVERVKHRNRNDRVNSIHLQFCA